MGKQHVPVREGQSKYRVIRNIFPVDEFLDHIIVNTERKYPGRDLYLFQMFRAQILYLGDIFVIRKSICRILLSLSINYVRTSIIRFLEEPIDVIDCDAVCMMHLS
ncbi:hypothetical protein MCMEM_0750 [Methanococcoides methylutens MM1]|uniref:Uncharacterized protein n=1 Tax=Methanococcoides methylutens MM1 TaxID=1434104 RepID=A0A0E3SRA2_METMT|nr:hypothetical protein MCMEM_0750 [Methanococcoides methylutens MM1]